MSVITLTTDLGNNDQYVAQLKGSFLKRMPEAKVVDVSHNIPMHHIAKAAYFVKSTYTHFPEQSIHIVMVHSAYVARPTILLVQHDGHVFLMPDNGILTILFPRIPMNQVRVIKMDDIADHQFDIYSHVCACVNQGLIEECSSHISSINEKYSVQPVVNVDEIRGTIIHVDVMENVVTNITREIFDKAREGREYEIYYKHNSPITQLATSYADVPVGEPLALFNSAGHLEISVNMGKASSLYGLFENETIQILFK